MNKFKKAYSDIEKKIKADKELISSIKILGLLGSVADEEGSSSWSDLDVLVVLKTNKLGSISSIVLNKLKKISEKVSERYSFPISILPHTEDDFRNYVCFEYLRHYSEGKITYPTQSSLKKVIFKLLDNRKTSERVRRSYCLYHLRHIRFNFIRKYISVNKYNSKEPSKQICKLLIDKMIKVTDLALNYHDIWPIRKQDILNEANKNLSIDTSELKEALGLRTKWTKVTEIDAKNFLSNGIRYLHRVIENILAKENNRSTPEESMSLL